MLKIEINPCEMSRQQLIDTATFLMKLAGVELLPRQSEPVPMPLIETPATPVAMPLIETPATPVDVLPRPIKKGVELDTAGLPWDARIHSRTKSKNPDGTWKIQRGLDLKTVDRVEEQLKNTLASAAIPVKNEALPAVDEPVAPPPMDFPALMQKITGLIHTGKITQKQVAEAVNSVGVPSLPVLPTQPHLIPSVSLYIDNLI